MPYVITKSNGTVFTTVNDATLDNKTSLTFTGRNYSGYGEFLNQNFFSLLENFANDVAPTKPVKGQLWFDTASPNNPKLRICYDGEHFKDVVNIPINDQYHSPSNPAVGELWYVSDLNQLRVRGENGWIDPSTFSKACLIPGPEVDIPPEGTMAVADGTTWNPNSDGLQHLMIYLDGTWKFVVSSSQGTITTADFATTATTANSLNTANAYRGTIFTATNYFSGPGTGLTGTAAGLNIGGNAATATSSTTQLVGNSTTAIATTAFVKNTIQTLYPVGSIYTSTVNTNPATLFGFGTWVAFGAGRVMIGDGGGFSAGATGGSADAVVVSHTHAATVTDPGHDHGVNAVGFIGSGSYALPGGVGQPQITSTNLAATGISVSNSTVGVSGTNANLQPYVVVYMWNRTA
jgi:hypothetical protein